MVYYIYNSKREGIFMLNLVKNMVKENGIRKTLNYLTTNEFSEKELKDLENCHILNMGIPSLSLLYSFVK